MSYIPFRIGRATASVLANYTGAVGEILMDTTNDTIVLQNGQRGGVRLATTAVATTVKSGLMSAEDKAKLDSISESATYYAGNGIVLDGHTFSLADSGVTPGIYGPTGQYVEPLPGDSFNVPYLEIDVSGRVTYAANAVITLPDYYTFTAGAGITISSDKVISLQTLQSGTFGQSTNASLSFGDSFSVPYITVDDYGRVIANSSKTVTLTLPSITVGTGLSISGNAISLASGVVTAGSYGPSTNASPGLGGTFSVPYVTVDTYGRVTAVSSKTITMPTFTDTDTHYTGYLRAGASTGTDNAAVTSNPYLKYVENSTVRSYVRLVAGTGTTIASDSSGNVTIGLTTSGVSSGSYGPSANASPGSGGTFSVPYVTVDTYGRVTAASSKTITMPTFTDTDTHYTGYLRAGTSSGTANAAVTSNPYLIYVENSTHRSHVRLVAGTGTAISSDSSGNVTIAAADTTYSLPTASSSTLGGVKIGSNISISSGTISVATATTSALGVMKVGTGLSVSSGTVSVDTGTIATIGSAQTFTGVKRFSQLQVYTTSSTTVTAGGAIHLNNPNASKADYSSYGSTNYFGGAIYFHYGLSTTSTSTSCGSASFNTATAYIGQYCTSGGSSFAFRVFPPNTVGTTSQGFYVSYNNSANDYRFIPTTSGSIVLGYTGALWKQVYASTTTISTSDERKKSEIQDFDDALLDAWADVPWLSFKFNDAIEEKGSDKARIHAGSIAQRIDKVFASHGLDASRYAFFCHGTVEAQDAVYDDEGTLVQEATEAVDEYSLRYEEALCIEAAYQRRRYNRLEARITAIEKYLGV